MPQTPSWDMTPAHSRQQLRIAMRIDRQDRAAQMSINAWAFRGEAKELTRKINRDSQDD
jgi:hypothetical protein